MTDGNKTAELRAAAIAFAVACGKEAYKINDKMRRANGLDVELYREYDEAERKAEREMHGCLCAMRAAFKNPSAPLRFGMYGEFDGEALECLRECVRLSKAHSVYVAGFFIAGDTERGIELSESFCGIGIEFTGFLADLRDAMDKAYFRTSRYTEYTDPDDAEEREREERWLVEACGYNPFAARKKAA